MNDDLDEMVQRDIEKFQNRSFRGGNRWGPAAYAEIGFGAVAAVIALVWLVSLLWVPDPIGGRTWMSMGMLGLTIFGGPAVAIYWLRRGGAAVIRRAVREMAR